jgi:hypothetical protein
VKLYCICINDDVEGNGYLEDGSNSKHRTEFADGRFSHHVFNFLSCYISYLQIRSKLLCSNALFQNSLKSIVITDSTLLSCFEMQIKNFNIDAKFPNTNSIFSHHSVVVNVKQVHCQWKDWPLEYSDDTMVTKIVRRQSIDYLLCRDSCHELLVGLCRFLVIFVM